MGDAWRICGDEDDLRVSWLGRFTRVLLQGLAIVLVWFVVFLDVVFVLRLLLVVGLLLLLPDHRVSSQFDQRTIPWSLADAFGLSRTDSCLRCFELVSSQFLCTWTASIPRDQSQPESKKKPSSSMDVCSFSVNLEQICGKGTMPYELLSGHAYSR